MSKIFRMQRLRTLLQPKKLGQATVEVQVGRIQKASVVHGSAAISRVFSSHDESFVSQDKLTMSGDSVNQTLDPVPALVSYGLSPRGVETLVHKTGKGPVDVIVQVIHVTKLPAPSGDRYKCLLSDGRSFIPGFLSVPYNLDCQGRLQVNSLLCIHNHVYQEVQEKSAIMVAKATMLPYNPGRRFGLPVEFLNEPKKNHTTNTKQSAKAIPRAASPHTFNYPLPKKPIPQAIIVERRLDWGKDMEKILDDMFEKQTSEQLKDVPQIAMPLQFQNTELFDHQEQGIRWLVHQEISGKPPTFYKHVTEKGAPKWLCKITGHLQPEQPPSLRGSILADDMGLGKTLQTLGLILAAPPLNHTYPAGNEAMISRSAVSHLQLSNGSEMAKERALGQTGEGSFGEKADPVSNRASSNITNTTIHGGHFDESSPSRYLTPFCTLIVAPVSVLSNWERQVKNHVKEGVLRVKVYQGKTRQSLIQRVLNNEIDILLVGYETLVADYKKRKEGLRSGSLFSIPFHRIVLDEAHKIRTSGTLAFEAVKKIQAERKLALTGTPFVNCAGDIQSLFAFLDLTHLGNKATFQTLISEPIRDKKEIGLKRLRFVLAHVALRRSKAVTNINLVEKQTELRVIAFPNGPDKDVYEALYQAAREGVRAVLPAVEASLLDDWNYGCVLAVLTRLRQSCCSWMMVRKELREEEVLKIWRNIQKQLMIAPLTPQEGHELLKKLGLKTSETSQRSVCLGEVDEAAVRAENRKVFASPFLNVNTSVKTISVDGSIYSPKIDALLEATKEMQADEKGVIFSQFTSFLDIIAEVFDIEGIEFQRIDGRMNTEKRSHAITEFMEDSGPRFILCSLHAAGTGINLTRGNVVFMMDPWWNQAAEDQATDRVHRIGQKRDVRAIRFLMKDSLEERILELQVTKSLQAKGAFAKLSKEENKACFQELRQLLDL